MKRAKDAGFTLLELLIVVAISVVMVGLAIPIYNNAMGSYRFSACVSAITGAIETTRYQAIMHGCSYEIVFDPSYLTYQVYSEAGAVGATSCLGSYTAVGSAIPLPSAGPISLVGATGCTSTTALTGCSAVVGDVTFMFSPNGTVSSNPAGASIEIFNSNPTGVYTVVKNSLITVSGVGYVTSNSLPSSPTL